MGSLQSYNFYTALKRAFIRHSEIAWAMIYVRTYVALGLLNLLRR